ncbi:MAG: hypothetical protein HYX81_05190 [Chloroflexi bacterium]|nr:hypothetical protein [Chloroflexota bacterium]
MKKRILVMLLCFLGAALLFTSGKGLFFYKGMYQASSVELPSPKDIVIPTLKSEPPPEVSGRRAGTVLVDFVHGNNFSPKEINTLLSRVMAQGFTIEFLKSDGMRGNSQEEELQKRLRYGDAFIVISPMDAFSSKEIKLIEEFVGKGGKLLLIEDPLRRPKDDLFVRQRSFPINDIAGRFGVLFESDYLYNLKDNESNYRHVFFTNFSQDQLTKDLTKIALYSVGSLRGTGTGIVFADENTHSNAGAQDKLSPLVLAAGGKVLSIYDSTFMTEPFNASFDNNRLIANISDWLTKSGRVFSLSDFPYFLKGSPSVTYADVSLLRRGLEMKDFLQEQGKSISIAKYEETADLTQDMVFLSLSKDATKVKKFLEKGGIKLVGTDIEIANIGSIPQADTSMIYLYESGARHLLVVLADTEKRLEKTVDLLKDDDFRQWLVSDTLAIIQESSTK